MEVRVGWGNVGPLKLDGLHIMRVKERGRSPFRGVGLHSFFLFLHRSNKIMFRN